MAHLNLILTLILLSWPTLLASQDTRKGPDYVREACSVTRYQDLCIHSLAPFSNIAKRSPGCWARAGVSVTLSESKSVAQFLLKLKKSNYLKGRMRRIALTDCMELFQDAIDNLHRSLGVLRKLNGQAFEVQMKDLTTWMSAALTDVDTCLDGFDGRRGNQVKLVKNRVVNVTYITSNALALVTKLAASGVLSMPDP